MMIIMMGLLSHDTVGSKDHIVPIIIVDLNTLPYCAPLQSKVFIYMSVIFYYLPFIDLDVNPCLGTFFKLK